MRTCLVTQSCPTLCNRKDCCPPGSSVHGILQARILECIAIPFSRGSSWPRDWTQVSCIAGVYFTSWATREADNNGYGFRPGRRAPVVEGAERDQSKGMGRTPPRSHVHSTSPLKTVLILWTQFTKWFLNVITIYIAFMIMLLLNLIRILPEHQIFARRCFVKSTIEFVTTWLSPRQSTGQSCRTNDVGSRWAFPIEPAFNIDLIIFTKDR